MQGQRALLLALLLPTAYFLLAAYCLLRTCFLLPTAYCILPTSLCLLLTGFSLCDLYVSPPQIRQNRVQKPLILSVQISFCLVLEHCDRVNGVLCKGKVFVRLSGVRISDLTEIDQGGGTETEYQ